MLVLKEKKDCTGCGACYFRCPKEAISMKRDEEGFAYPFIDESLCIHCGLCRKICPQNNENKYLNTGAKKFYGGLVNDENILLKSSSGGAFTSICSSLDEDAIICGSRFVKGLKAEHYCCKNNEEINQFRKSKYFESNLKNVYPEIKDYLKKGKKVLFSGTACQVAGLYAFLGEKPLNLFTVDLICHGVPSQFVFDSYVKSLKKNNKIDIKWYSFREKKYFWGDWEIGVAFGDNYKKKYRAWGQDEYMYGFLRGLYYRPVCYLCKYANSNISRAADITIGDFWGSQNVNSDFNEKKGSSLVIINSDRGIQLLNNIKSTMNLIEIDEITAIKENHNLVEPSKENLLRDDFYSKLIKGDSFKDIIFQYQKGSFKSHSQIVRVIVSKFFPLIVLKRRKKVINNRKKS